MKIFKFSKANGMYAKGSEVNLSDNVAKSFEKFGLGSIIEEKQKKLQRVKINKP